MIEIIPAIDIIEGKCVRLTQGDYAQKTIYNENPLEIAKQFEDAGLKRLHLVDLDGAKHKKIINHHVLEKIASNTNLIIDFGGGLQSDHDLKIAFESGAQMVTGGSIAVKNEEMFLGWLQKFGSEKIILGADAKDGKISVSGWQEGTDLDIIPFLGRFKQLGINKTISTDVAKDGLLQGPSTDLYTEILKQFPDLYLIASGGVSSITDIEELQNAHIPAVIVGKAIYEGRITLKQFEPYLC